MRSIDNMTLAELNEEKRSLIKQLRGDDATLITAKRFKSCCDAIRYVHEMRDWATNMNAGKATVRDVSMNLSEQVIF